MRRFPRRTMIPRFLAASTLLASALTLLAGDLRAQDRSAPARDAAATMRLLRAEGHTGTAVRTMRDAQTAGATARANALADSLAAFVITNSASDDWIPAVQAAVSAIGAAGLARGEGTPYGGALERLMRIVEESESPMAGALYYVTLLPDRPNAVARLGRLASTAHPLAVRAIEFLDERMGDQGVMELRRLHQQSSVLDPHARRLLHDIAARNGWER